MNSPSPAIVAQSAVRRFPRPVLLAFCLAYILAGFVGRDAWKSADMAALGFMVELAQGTSDWLHPSLVGMEPEFPALLPYWLGAAAWSLAPGWMAPDFAVRIPFGVLLALAMVGTWYGAYYLARSPLAQPVAFAFGGEAQPTDYARTVADGALLALLACLGLAHLSHETTPALVQLGASALLYFAWAALPLRPGQAALAALLGSLGLALSGAPTLSLLWSLGGATLHLCDPHSLDRGTPWGQRLRQTLPLLLAAALAASLAWHWDQWRFKLNAPTLDLREWLGFGELLVWFPWPAWPLALWTLWCWRKRLLGRTLNRHLVLPLWWVLVALATAALTGAPDRSLLTALPALAALAAFALPTLKRSMASLVDWFTLLFFSGCGFIIWVVWIAMQTGFPPQPAANVARLAPDFSPRFSLLALGLALAATLVWAWLVHWRAGRHRTALWKSLVLPAGGAALCWLLLMTLWLPLLDHAQSYRVLLQRTRHALQDQPGAQCMAIHPSLNMGTVAALRVYGPLPLQPLRMDSPCEWLAADALDGNTLPTSITMHGWQAHTLVRNGVGGFENYWLLRRIAR
ncbi:MAG: hypothetical protein ACT4NV_12705 [Rhodoferax sp.]